MKGLEGVLVLDFSKLLPGPFCTMMLADLGCRVVRVELPHWPDPAREMPPVVGGQGAAYRMVNRNKLSLCLDFRKPEGLAAIKRLVAKAGVVVEGFRPGMMDKLGLGPKELLKEHPGLVYCSITGYGADSPWCRKAGHDINFQAVSGLLSLGDSSGQVSFPPLPLADIAASNYACIAILAALLDRAAGGKGRHLKLSMAEAVFTWQMMALAQRQAAPELRRKAYWWNGGHPFYRLYRTKDDRYLAVGALERNFAVDLLRQLGREDLEARLANGEGEPDEVLARELEVAFSRRTQAEWLQALEGKDVCVTPVLEVGEALAAPAWASLPPMDGPGAAFPRPPVATGERFEVRREPPALGADNREVLRSAGFSAADIARLENAALLVAK